jgi:hypothetical protein
LEPASAADNAALSAGETVSVSDAAQVNVEERMA